MYAFTISHEHLRMPQLFELLKEGGCDLNSLTFLVHNYYNADLGSDIPPFKPIEFEGITFYVATAIELQSDSHNNVEETLITAHHNLREINTRNLYLDATFVIRGVEYIVWQVCTNNLDFLQDLLKKNPTGKISKTDLFSKT